MRHRYDRRAIMRRAHGLKQQGTEFPVALKQAWAEAKSTRVPALPPQRLPLEALVLDTYALVKKVTNARKIRVGVRVRVDVGVALDEIHYAKTLSGAVVYSNAPTALAP